MARIRTIKPEFWTNEKLSRLPEVSHMTAAALLNYADDEGYFNANPGLIKAAIFPLREPSRSIPVVLHDLSNVGFLRMGTGSDGRSYGHIVNFNSHQTINKQSKSKIKSLEIEWADYGRTTGLLPEPSHTEQGTGNREQGKEQGMEVGPAPRGDAEPSPEFLKIPLIKRDGEFIITKAHIAEWQETFPGLDVEQWVRTIRQWNVANTAQRKTRSGMLRHITGWLAKEQNRARRIPPAEVVVGECQWNVHGNREPGRPKCDRPAVVEKRGIPYCKVHADRNSV